jgi:primosomal protein N' (replication factor Y)
LIFANIAVAPLYPLFTYILEEGSPLNVGDQVEISFHYRKRIGYVISISESLPENSPLSAKNLKVIPANLKANQFAKAFNESDLKFYQWIASYYQEPLSLILETAIPSIKIGKTSKKILSPEILDPPDTFLLNDEQQLAASEIAKQLSDPKFSVTLLHGITGSGKTAVYLEAAKAALNLGCHVLVLVPEIALTPQLVNRFLSNLGGTVLREEVGILHSGVRPLTKWHSWEKILSGEIRLVLGVRSAVFAPLPKLKLIIVDEEHDGSFKQQDGLRYNARDLSIVRGHLNNAPVLLGSATPSLETYLHTKTENWRYLSLKKRVGNVKPPKYEIVDLNKIPLNEMASPNISPALFARMEETLKAGAQVFLLINRRGHSTWLQCSACGFVLSCPHCSVPMVLHKRKNTLQCHHCEYSSTIIKSCAEAEDNLPMATGVCLSSVGTYGIFNRRGGGTEKIIDEVGSLFPKAKLVQFDRDVIRSEKDIKKTLDEIRNGIANIVVGTQMLAKGHDMPNVQLVGVVDCDVGLHIPDFRASERAFQLLTQAGGRAGRRKIQGRVILQTRSPNHPAIQCTFREDFENLAEYELKLREAHRYPPFTKMVRVIASHKDPLIPKIFLSNVKLALQELVGDKNQEIFLLGPATATIERLKDLWRWHLVIRANRRSTLTKALKIINGVPKTPSTIKVIVDIDPQDML